MVELTLGGRVFAFAPYKLGSMEKAAPALDRFNAKVAAAKATATAKAAAGEEPDDETMVGLTGTLSDIVEVLSIGMIKSDPSLTLEDIKDLVGNDDAPVIMAAFFEVMGQSGMAASGEASAPPAKPRRARRAAGA